MATLRILGFIFAFLIAILFFHTVWGIRTTNPGGFYLLLAGGIALCAWGLWSFFRPRWERRRILNTPFPEGWRQILEREVRFYLDLDEEERHRFEKRLQFFLGTTRITGVETEVDDEVRVLVGAGAVIPIFRFPDWAYHNLDEVLIYPGTFDSHSFADVSGGDRAALGMVGEGVMNRKMILSRPALIAGFRKPTDGHNTGIHEFVHLLDASDGAFDGIPALMEKPYVKPWLGLMHREMKRIDRRKSKLRPYGATNKVEFFAVAAEYFFERPEELKKDHPELYRQLRQFFGAPEV